MADPLPLPTEAHLKTLHVGKSLDELPIPAAILDRAKASQNCKLLLSAVSPGPPDSLGAAAGPSEKRSERVSRIVDSPAHRLKLQVSASERM